MFSNFFMYTCISRALKWRVGSNFCYRSSRGMNRSSKNWHKLQAGQMAISLSDSDEDDKLPEKVQKRMLERKYATRLPFECSECWNGNMLPTPAPAPMKAKVICRNKSHLSTCRGVGPGCQRSLCRGSPPETKAKAPDSQPTSSTATSATQAMATATKNPLLAPEQTKAFMAELAETKCKDKSKELPATPIPRIDERIVCTNPHHGPECRGGSPGCIFRLIVNLENTLSDCAETQLEETQIE